MRLVLDTNIYCDFAEGVPGVVDTIANFGEKIYLPAVVIAELTFGFMKGSQQEDNEQKLQYIIDQLQIEILNINKNVARKYALIYLHLVKKGRKIPINDVWIAACCMEVGGTLLTRDKHFRSIELIDCFPVNEF
ncbi:MAG: type II toxin-antitoxin system VapC family toxin [Deltaproteobacteria bacterium]|nr:type II toxin-antitoxin system VapC family toxin [Deltaproteobacteria bacterium]